jgi:hypothetical protein
MSRFDHLANQGYENLDTNVVLRPTAPRRQRTKVAPILAKVGYWGGAIIGGVAAASCGVKGRAVGGAAILVGFAAAAVLGLLGLVVDGLASAVDG